MIKGKPRILVAKRRERKKVFFPAYQKLKEKEILFVSCGKKERGIYCLGMVYGNHKTRTGQETITSNVTYC